MVADTVEELHEFAAKIGLKRSWFQDKSLPHYDLTKRRRTMALLAGAIEIDRRKLVEIIRKHRTKNAIHPERSQISD